MEHFDSFGDEFGFSEASADMFLCARDTSIDGVDIEVTRVGDIASDHGSLEEVDIVHIVDDSSGVIDIFEFTFFVLIAVDIDEMDSSPGGAEMDFLSRKMEVIGRVLAVECNIACGHLNGFIDDFSRETNAPIIAGDCPEGAHIFDAAFGGLAKADFFKDLIDGINDGLEGGVIKGSVGAAFEARAYGAQFFSEGSCSQAFSCLASARTS